jgi:threonine/homoserine efflux transporter RhtA
MMWMIPAIVTAIILLVLLGFYITTDKKMGRSRGRGMSEGLAIGMLASAAICIPLCELGGYRDAVNYLLPCGVAAGGVIGFLLERRYQRQ